MLHTRHPRAALTSCILATAISLAGGSARASVPGDEHWDNQFGPVGANVGLWSVVVRSNTVFVGGTLTAAGNTKANGVAGYDGTNWFALNNGIIGEFNFTYVFALARDENYLYAGGIFTNADNSGARAIARWDGSDWSPMGSLPGYVFSLRFIGPTLYAGGIFATTNATYNCLARWAGTNWTMIPGEFAGGLPTVNAIDTDGTNLYLGGVFTGVDGVHSTNVIGWDGSAWFALGNGIRGSSVQGLVFQNNKLYAGGSFTNTSGSVFTNLAVWNGSTWTAWGNANRIVSWLLSDGTNIYASGEFSTIGGISARSIAKWDGLSWSPLGAGLRGFANSIADVYRMTFDAHGRLYAAGLFSVAGTVGAINVAGWDGTNWFSLGASTSKGTGGPIGSVRSLLPVGTNLYVGGIFTEAGDVVANGLARWNGTNWSPLGSGFVTTFTSTSSPPSISALASFGGDLYAGGNFNMAGGAPAKGIARWDGNGWFNIGDADSTVSALAYDGAYLWAGGAFTNIGGVNSPGVALYYPDAGWFSLGGASGGGQNVGALAVDASGDVFVGGNFTSVGGVNATNIARWSWSTGWNALGNGVNGTVGAIAATNGLVYVGGRFTTAGGAPANRIARWNGSSWSALGSGAIGSSSSAQVNAIALRDTNVYIGGNFTNAGGLNTPGVAKWNGVSWSALGSGLATSPGTAAGSAFAFVGDDLYLGGTFNFAGDKPSAFIGRWNEQINFYPPPNLRLTKTAWPANGQFRFRVAGTSGERYVIQASTNLQSWTPVLTNSATLYDFTDTNASNFPFRVFRAVIPP